MAAVAALTLAAGSAAVLVSGVTHDSRQVQPGDVYAALPGFTAHGASFAAQAARAGAAAVVTDEAGRDEAVATGLAVLVAEDARSAMGHLAAWAYGYPSHHLLVVGITGTNGKTTMTYLLDAALRAEGRRTGVIGTVGTRIGDEVVPTVRTTPESTDVHALLAVMLERGVSAVSMEVSSHALVLGRVDGVEFDVAVFTNLTQDHLDFHGSMEEYFAAKASLFVPERTGRGVVCVDDGWGRALASASPIPVTTYATVPGLDASWQVLDVVSSDAGGTSAVVAGPDGAAREVHAPLPGAFNLANTLGALAALAAAGCDEAVARAALATAPGVPGRLERVAGPDPQVAAFVDYAHTPDAVERVVSTVRDLAAGRVLVVLGCGGDRDRDKRGPMGATAARLADVVIVTDDNPRSEPPEAIRASVLAGARGVPGEHDVREVGDRRQAVREAVAAAAPGDVVLVLGKGHETGQEVSGTVHPFDDRLVLAAALAETARRAGPEAPG